MEGRTYTAIYLHLKISKVLDRGKHIFRPVFDMNSLTGFNVRNSFLQMSAHECYVISRGYAGTVITSFYFAIIPANLVTGSKQTNQNMNQMIAHYFCLCVIPKKDMAFQRQNLINICPCIVVQ